MIDRDRVEVIELSRGGSGRAGSGMVQIPEQPLERLIVGVRIVQPGLEVRTPEGCIARPASVDDVLAAREFFVVTPSDVVVLGPSCGVPYALAAMGRMGSA